jgi:hypothetical protein
MTTKEKNSSNSSTGSATGEHGASAGLSGSDAFASALAGVTAIKQFRVDVLESLKKQENELPRAAWRKKFRRDLPFWQLLSRDQQRHMRYIFAHMLPDPDVDVSSFDPDERLMLDVVAEQYIHQALVFVEMVEAEQYNARKELDRDFPGRILALTFSASLFFFDTPDEYGKRGYTYKNIYGNRSIPAEGRCRLKGSFERGESIQSLEFHTSAIQLLAVIEAASDSGKIEAFDHQSRRFQRSFSDTFHGISVKARDTFSGFLSELTSSSQMQAIETENDNGTAEDKDESAHTGELDEIKDSEKPQSEGGSDEPKSEDKERLVSAEDLDDEPDPVT